MHPAFRKILYAVAFETGGIVMATVALRLMSDAGGAKSFSLAVFSAAVALSWSFAFNTAFEAWETRQTTKGRSLLRRTIHAVLFEGGLVLILLPSTAWWLSTTIWLALTYEAVLIGLFLVYAWGFTWVFDKLLGLPNSAK